MNRINAILPDEYDPYADDDDNNGEPSVDPDIYFDEGEQEDPVPA
jgi:hypothetical protein